MRRLSALLLILTSLAAGPALADSRIFIAGDSTAAHYGQERYPQLGWGMVLACNLDGAVTVENRAAGGRSTKSYIAEGRFDALFRDIAAGDTLLVQFGHNDTTIAKPERYTPLPDFRINLLRFIATAREKGTRPVLLTPVAIRSFDRGVLQETLGDYAAMTRAVARETGTPLIDLAADSRAYFQTIGEEPSKAFYLHYGREAGYPRWPEGIQDDIHFSEIGARAVASLVAARLQVLALPVSALVRPLSPINPPTLGGPTCP